MTIGEFKPDTYAVDVTLSGHLVLLKKIVYSISSAIVCKVVSFVIIFNMKGMYHGIHLSPTITQKFLMDMVCHTLLSEKMASYCQFAIKLSHLLTLNTDHIA